MCGQTFSKAVNLPLRQNTPTSVPSTSTTLRPGSGKAAALPMTTSCMRHPPNLKHLRSPTAAVPHCQVEQADVDRTEHFADHEHHLGRGDLLDRDWSRKCSLC